MKGDKMRAKTRQRLLAALAHDDNGREFDKIGRKLGLIRGGFVHGEATTQDLAERVRPRPR